MLTPLKTLEEKLTQLLALVKHIRTDNFALRDDNQKLRAQNHQLLERITQAQGRIDQLLQSLEHSEESHNSDGSNS